MELIELMLVLATIVGVADGNTVRVKVDSGETGAVKLACINIPETVKQQYRIAATQKLKKLLPSGTPVVIRVVQSGESDRDRAVGEVFLDNRSVNLRLVEEGNAVVDRATLSNCQENKTQFLIAEANAKNKRLGLWQQLPQFPRK